jgi:hypothetical protein
MLKRTLRRCFPLFAACLGAAFLFSGILETSHEHHAGDEASCPICIIARHTENSFKQPRNISPRFAFPLEFLLLSAFLLKTVLYNIPASSVKLKIKLNT